MSTSIRLNDYGTLLRVNTGSDLTSTTVRKLIYKKPDGVVGEWTASVADTTYLEYTTQSGDIDQTGTWKIHAYVETATGAWNGDLATFDVEKSYQVTP